MKTPLLADEIVRMIQAERPGGAEGKTNDTIKTGDAQQPVKGVVVTFMATVEVLEEAARLGANLIITHEPTFYNHHDETDWLLSDPVYLAKMEILNRHGMVVWRLHDGLHRHRPDDILQGMLQKLGWQPSADSQRPNLIDVGPISLRNLATACRTALKIGAVRIAGYPDMACKRIALLPGACGGRRQIENLMISDVDAVICGESAEWETCEYVRDACRSGIPKGLIVLGHANSEEAGMQHCADWLRTLLPGSLPVHYLPAGNPFISL